MKKAIAILLLLALSFTTLTACNGGEEDTGSTMSEVSIDAEADYKDENGNYRPRQAIEDQKERTFSIIVRGAAAGTYQSEDFTTESELYGDLLNNAVRERNNKVEELYNITLDVIKSDTIDEDIRLDSASSLGEFDAIMPTLKYLSNLASQGYLYDLTQLNNFDIDAPWWDANCTKGFSVNNKVYFTTGDITILNKVCTPSILFNKGMIASNGLDNPYELVESKEWTYDKMVEMAKAVTQYATTDGSYSNENIYGMVTAYGDALSFYRASNESICAKDANDQPYISVGKSERSVNIAQKVLQTYANENFYIFAETCEAPIWETSFEIFYGGRALFRPSGFSATTKARKLSQIEFGILPFPLMDDSQEDYVTGCGSGEVAGIAIPVCAPDPEFSAYMIQAYAAYAKNYITKAYIETNLRYRDARDDESLDMLNIIFDNIVYDVGEVYDFGGMATMFRELSKNKSFDIVSAIEARRSEAELSLENVIDMYAD